VQSASSFHGTFRTRDAVGTKTASLMVSAGNLPGPTTPPGNLQRRLIPPAGAQRRSRRWSYAGPTFTNFV
jgi:hypothetical protein